MGHFGRATRAYDWIFAKLRSYAAIPLRLIVGYGFMEHGYAKIVTGDGGLQGGRNPKAQLAVVQRDRLSGNVIHHLK
jgi:uncharacterized membrane protein YphA (DoxX/SURF4 family)